MKSDTLFKGVSENIIMLVLVLIIYPKYLIECKCFIPLVKNNVKYNLSIVPSGTKAFILNTKDIWDFCLGGLKG
ncbi:hypothetical protein NP0157_02610 [Helicobacter pylori]